MAITIEQELDEINPAYNRMNYVVSSTNTSQPNFKYVADVYIDGTYVKRETYPPHPTLNVANVDIHGVVESFVTYDLSNTVATSQALNTWCKVQVKFGEQYGLSSSGVTVYPDLTNSTAVYAYAGSLTEFDKIDYVDDNYILDSSGSLFMTNIPRTFNLRRNQNMNIGIYQNQDDVFVHSVYVTYDSAGNLIDEYQVFNNFGTPQIDEDDRFLIIPFGYNVNSVDVGDFTTGTPPVLTDSVAYYDFYTINGGSVITSETIRVNLIDDCSPHESFELHFQNAFGFFDSFVFSKGNTENVNIDRREYKKQTGTLSANAFTVSKQDRGYENYFTSSNRTLTLRSRWVTETEFTWLRELLESPQVYWLKDSEFIAINVTNTSYERKKTASENVFNVELQIKLSTNDYRQRY